jgi:cell division protein FtsB
MLKKLITLPWQTLLLLVLVVLIQYPLWLGKGGWLRVGGLDRQVKQQEVENQKLRARNDAISGEVRDLKTGLLAIEERARFEHDMIKPGEIFVSVMGTKSGLKTSLPIEAEKSAQSPSR